MGKLRRAVSRIIGGTQCILGGFASVFAYVLYTSQPVQEALSINADEVFLFMFLLLAFGIFSIGSGLFLVSEKEGGD